MKDAKDIRTADLLLPPKLGRPISGNALTNAQKQKAYRARKQAQGTVTVLLTMDELLVAVRGLNGFLSEAEAVDVVGFVDTVNLLERLNKLFDKSQEKHVVTTNAPKAIRRAQIRPGADEISAPIPGKARSVSQSKKNQENAGRAVDSTS